MIFIGDLVRVKGFGADIVGTAVSRPWSRLYHEVMIDVKVETDGKAVIGSFVLSDVERLSDVAESETFKAVRKWEENYERVQSEIHKGDKVVIVNDGLPFPKGTECLVIQEGVSIDGSVDYSVVCKLHHVRYVVNAEDVTLVEKECWEVAEEFLPPHDNPTAPEFPKPLRDNGAQSAPIDPVNPTHYQGEACLDAIRTSNTPEAFRGFLKGNIQKYMWRYENKGTPVADLRKARWYLDKLISEVEND